MKIPAGAITIHKDPERRERYVKRHQARENWILVVLASLEFTSLEASIRISNCSDVFVISLI